MGKWTNLAVGSLAGGFSRYLLATFVYGLFGTAFPYGTFVVNMIGCLLIGVFDGLSDRLLIGADVKILLMTGFCGAFTTFSTLIFETDHLIRHGDWLRAAANVGGSLVLGILLFRIGLFAAR